ncbi:MAG: hypothetical protein ACOC95_07970 [Planctomycetota bacterium]
MEPTWHRTLERLLDLYDPQRGLVRKSGVHGVGHSSPRLAELLLRRGAPGDRDTAVRIIEEVLAQQYREPGIDEGRFPMLTPSSGADLNGTLFLIDPLVTIAEEHADLLPGDLSQRLDQALRRAVVAVERRWEYEVFDIHRDFTAYSNIFALYVRSLLQLARHFDDDRLRRAGEGQWRRWFIHTSYHGVDEFVSPNYNAIVLNALRAMRAIAPSDAARAEMAMMHAYLLALQFGLHHPRLGLPVSGVSRDYRRFLDPGTGGVVDPDDDDDTGGRAPAAVLEEYRHRQYPYRASGRAGITPFRFATWQTNRGGLGSMTGGHYFWQQIHLMAAVGNAPAERAIAYLNGDRMNLLNGWVAQADHRALCLTARTTLSYYHTQLRERPADLPAPRSKPVCLGLVGDWAIEQADDEGIILRAYGHALHVHPFAIDDGRIQPNRWREDVVEIGGHSVRALRAEDHWTWAGCVVDLRPDADGRPQRPDLSVTDDPTRLVLTERGGLRIDLTRLPSGECVETYDRDPRTLPLLTTPAYTLQPGELTWRAAQPV